MILYGVPAIVHVFARGAVWVLVMLPFLASAQTSSDRLDSIRRAGELRVCIWPEYFAISYRNPRSGHLEGIDIDLAGQLAADLGVGVKFVDTSFATFLDALDDDRCDVAMFGVGITDQRAGRVAFSSPYLRSDVYAVTTKSQSRIRNWADIDRPGVVVAVQAGTYMEPLMRRTLKYAELMSVAAPKTREMEIQSGRADVFISDYPYTRRMLLFFDWTVVIEAPSPVSPTSYAYAVKKGNPAWLSRVDAFVAAIKRDGRLAQAAARNGLSAIVVP